MGEPAASIPHGETPLDYDAVAIALGRPGGGLVAQAVEAGDTPVEALLPGDAQFRLGHVQPAPVLGGVVGLEAPGQLASFFRRERVVEAGQGMGRPLLCMAERREVQPQSTPPPILTSQVGPTLAAAREDERVAPCVRVLVVPFCLISQCLGFVLVDRPIRMFRRGVECVKLERLRH